MDSQSNCHNSSAPEGIKQYVWEFGDGTEETLNEGDGETTHEYGSPGIYNITLTITDNLNQTDSHTSYVSMVPADVPNATVGGPYYITNHQFGDERIGLTIINWFY
jgi:PKD domain.